MVGEVRSTVFDRIQMGKTEDSDRGTFFYISVVCGDIVI